MKTSRVSSFLAAASVSASFSASVFVSVSASPPGSGPPAAVVGAARALAAAVGLGALSTVGDWIWVHYLTDGALVPAIVHGALIFLALAAALALGTDAARRRSAWSLLAFALPILGIAIAAIFYPLAMLVGYLVALLLSWVAMWLGTATIQRAALGGVETLGRAWLRGALAALGSGLAFWAISDIWTRPAPGGPNYAWHFFAWTLAFLPGFLALFLFQPRPTAEPATGLAARPAAGLAAPTRETRP